MRNTSSRLVCENTIQHIYKRSSDNGVLFYRPIDHLVFYTIQAVAARKHRVHVLATSHMYTHVHEALRVFDSAQLAAYERDTNSFFAREYNCEVGRSGPVFESPYGRAPKTNNKAIRSCLAYVFNNPVEKKLCRTAVADRWTFLAYYDGDYPFSQKPQMSHARMRLREAFRIVNHECAAGRYLSYTLLHRLFASLDPFEKEQLVDYIIQQYFFFAREECYRYFGSYRELVEAVNISTGSEFDVGEVYEPLSDIPYREMADLVTKHKMMGPGLSFLHLPDDRLGKLASYLIGQTGATNRQIARFLHRVDERGNAWGILRGE